MKTDRNFYVAPTLKTLEFGAESGFAASGTAGADAKTISDWENGNDDWFQY